MVAVITLGKWHHYRLWSRVVVGDGGDREEGNGSIIEKGERGGGDKSKEARGDSDIRP
jgi:hypothetical protein